MKTEDIILAIFMILISFSVLFCLTIGMLGLALEHDTIKIETKCYDRLNNEIKNVICYEKVQCNYKWRILNDFDCPK